MPYDELITVEWQRIVKIAEEWHVLPQAIEKSCLRAGIIPQRYSRNISSLSPAEQGLLLDARVGVCGCGGLGLYVVNHLARVGVGHITVWDPDVFSESNLNRQLLSAYTNLGQSKVEVCRKYIETINPAVSCNVQASRWEDADPSLFRQQQVLVDALDNIPSRLDLADACMKADLPLIHGAVGGWFGQLTVIMPGDPFLHNLYGPSTQTGIEKEQGTLSFTAAVIASLQAAETIKLLLHKDSDLKEHICMIDLLDMSMEKFKKCNGDVTEA